MNLKRYYINKCFTDISELKADGIYFSGTRGFGEFKSWWEDRDQAQLFTHRFYKNGHLHGEHKDWYSSGQLSSHSFHKEGVLDGEHKVYTPHGVKEVHELYKDGRKIKDYLK